jgi:hypothetical protein
MIYEETIILKDADSDSFSDAFSTAIQELNHLAEYCATVLSLSAGNRGFQVEYRLDGKGSELLCLGVAGVAAGYVGRVTGIRYYKNRDSACLELIF